VRGVRQRIGLREGTSSSARSFRARSSMKIPPIRQSGALAFALTAATFLVPATTYSQQHIALAIDSLGRRVYVNAPESAVERGSAVGLLAPSGYSPVLSNLKRLAGQTARALQVDAGLVDAVIQVESGYNVRARSPKGASGLMQLIPTTASRFGVSNPFDPADNIQGGVKYLGYLLKQFHGDVPLSLAAYNAGENAVLRSGGIPPFAETREYVRKIAAVYPPALSTTDPRKGDAMKFAASTLPISDNSVRGVPIYRFVDEHGVTHFVQ
jgi:soluble lytic murein transglycosylase-like protein